MTIALLLTVVSAVHWQHPAGFITTDTIAELGEKAATQEWARAVLESRRKALEPWVAIPSEQLKKVFPVKRSNVYHNFSCPDCRTRLKFDPFNPHSFHCDGCNKEFSPETDAGIYPKGNRYNGTMYDGWACIFYQTASSAAVHLALIGRMDGRDAWLKRARELLLLYAKTIKDLPTVQPGEGDPARILTYAREGDNVILNELAQACELLRDSMAPEERARVEEDALNRMLKDIMLQPIYSFDHNDIYQYHRTVLQTALALEREDLIDWSFGYGDYAPDKLPDHRSLRRIAATHFKPDGAFWELCSGYHLYPMDAFCQLAVVSHNIAHMDPARFPQEHYDFTNPNSPGGKVIKAALEWFVSMAMPDRTMTIVGDSPAPRSGMDSYATTAEVGYRYFDVRAVGDYETLRQGKRTWTGFLLGAPQIVQQPTPFTSSYLSSGWVSLRNEWEGNRVWAGLNALIPGGGHQHADRLTLTLFSQGKLLALEKATPYNEQVTRELGTLSPAHNTVTVDMTSQKQGEALTGPETPEVALFFAAPFIKFAEVHADRLYPQTQVFRRAIAVIEDIVVDVFRVTGGKTHDWIVNHAGPAPVLSIATRPASFEPAQWLANGTKHVLRAEPDADWSAQWTVEAVTSRLTMLGATGAQVYALETYPSDNAVVTPVHPPCHTLCVRRADDAPFIAVWDAWHDAPNLQSVTRAAGQDALVLQTKSNTYNILLGPGTAQFPDGLTLASDAALSVLRNRDAMACAGGAHFDVTTPQGPISLRLSERANAWADWSHGATQSTATQCIHYDTCAGTDHPRDASSITITLEGTPPQFPTSSQPRR